MSALGPALREGIPDAPVPRSSQLLMTIAAGQGGDRVTVGEIVDGLRDRAYGLVFVLLALPNIVPAPPGLGGAFGLVMTIFAVQLLFGAPEPRLPGFVRRWSFPRARCQHLLTRAQPFLARLERYCRPRWPALTSRRVERGLGLLFLVAGLAIAQPIPLTGAPPAVAVVLLALGILERDGLVILAGAIVAFATLAVVVLTSVVYAVGFDRIVDRMWFG